MSMKQYIALVLSVLCFAACVDVIDFDAPEADRIVTIDASITAGESLHTVLLSNSGRFDILEVPGDLAITGAAVSVTDGQGQQFDFNELIEGVYVNSTLMPVTGGTYQLTVELDGNVYQSAVETMPAPVPVSGLSFDFFTRNLNNTAGNLVQGEFVRLKASSSIDPGEYLRYRVDGTYQYNERASPRNLNPQFCYVDETIDINLNVIVDGNDFTQGSFENLEILELEVDYKFNQNYCFTALQGSINESAYLFWKAAADEFDRTGDIFETPPSQLRGNIANTGEADNVIGVFELINETRAQLLINTAEVGTPQSNCSFRDEFESCTNCLVINRSTLTKPSCFE